jgi:hypothetical protein
LISIEMDGKAGIMQIAQWDVGLGLRDNLVKI